MSRTPDLTSYDYILISTSAGKDSQAMMDIVCELAKEAGVLDRVIAVHADLGSVEWHGIAALAAEHAAHYGIPFQVVRKSESKGDLWTAVRERTAKLRAWEGVVAQAAETGRTVREVAEETLSGVYLKFALGRIKRLEKRGETPTVKAPQRAWPMTGTCYGTSDFKTSQIHKLATALSKRVKAETGRAGRVLDCVGLTKEESASRCQKLESYELANGLPYRVIKDNANQYLAKWYPVSDYTVADIWDRIAQAGTRYHYAYDLGMSRLSCRFCVCASEADLRVSAQHNNAHAQETIEMEQTAGTFRAAKSLGTIVGDVAAKYAGQPDTVQPHQQRLLPVVKAA